MIKWPPTLRKSVHGVVSAEFLSHKKNDRSNKNTTAGVVRAILAIIDPEKTPKIAWEKNELALPLINKLKESVGDRDGSLRASIWWDEEDVEIQRELAGICENMSEIFSSLHRVLSM